MAAVDFYCSEHSIPQLTHTIHSPSTSTALPCGSQRHHSISSKLTMDPRRLGIFLEQEQRFQPNAYHMHKAVNECERMQLLETVLQIEVRPSMELLFLLFIAILVSLPLCCCVLILAHLLLCVCAFSSLCSCSLHSHQYCIVYLLLRPKCSCMDASAVMYTLACKAKMPLHGHQYCNVPTCKATASRD